MSAPDPTAGERCRRRECRHICNDPERCPDMPATPDADDASERRWRGIRCSHESCIPYGICLVGVPYPSERKSPATLDADDASTYCGAEFGEVRAGECECPKCASDHPDPLQDWPLPGHLKSDASEPR